jgi:ferredoxin
MGNLLLSFLVVVLIMGGPLTLYFAIRILGNVWGGLKVSFIKTAEHPLALLVAWDNESFEIKISRIRIEMTELVPGGRSVAHSFTFEDSSAKRKTFALAFKLSDEDMRALTDNGLDGQARAVNMSTITVEVETVDGETQRFKIGKKKILASIAQPTILDKDIEVVADKLPDAWGVQTRVFPWRKVEEAVEDTPKAAGGHKAAAPVARGPVDFAVTKVWIEPGCIVCDACEAEAPLVFHVLADTCIVREGAPLDDAAAIKAAADGCPVDVIKYTKVPKAAANA